MKHKYRKQDLMLALNTALLCGLVGALSFLVFIAYKIIVHDDSWKNEWFLGVFFIAIWCALKYVRLRYVDVLNDDDIE